MHFGPTYWSTHAFDAKAYVHIDGGNQVTQHADKPQFDKKKDNPVVKEGNLNVKNLGSPVTPFNYPFIKGRDKSKKQEQGDGGGVQ